MRKKLTKILHLFLLLQVFATTKVAAQVLVSGNVYDSSKLYAIPGVNVYSTSGSFAVTDSLGAYHINVSNKDSLTFSYNGKSTIKFPVAEIKNYTSFDISLRVKTKEKYKLLNPVTVFTNSYQKDSLENREAYSNIFGEEKPGIHSTYDPGGAAGLDLDALIGMFQFRKNKQQQAFRNRLIDQEQENYVDYRFSAKTISRITGLRGDSLELYRKLYRPSYYFVVNSSLTQFYEYILNTSYAFRKKEQRYFN
ncbi:MAG TPA: hypothetical protein VN722_02400 [Hanamia sp.]|nr:hypothetical protein [Hanamia sp.]